MRIRDLFLEFDYDRNRTFDQDEVYSIFVMSNIPIKYEEVKELFGYNKKKKFLTFSEFISLTINEEFSQKFKNLIMNKIRYRTKEGDICPNDFNDMLAYLSEFGKLSDDLKSQIREKNMMNLSSNKNDSSDEDNSENLKINENEKEKGKDIELPILRMETSKKVEEDENKIINNRNPNLKNKEFEFKNFMEKNNQKLLRFKEYFVKANYRDKILKKKNEVSKSVQIIDSMYPNLAKNYICYFPTEDSFKRMKDNSDLTFISRNNRKRYNTIHSGSNSNNDSITRKSIIYNIYLNPPKKPKKKMYFESVEVKKKKVNDLEYAKLYDSLLTKEKKEEFIIPKIAKEKRKSVQMNNMFKFNKKKFNNE